MSQSCSHLLNRLTSSNNICCTPAYVTQMDNSGITSPGAEPGQRHNALSKDDTQFFQVKTLGWGYILGIEHMLSIREALGSSSSTLRKARKQNSFSAQRNIHRHSVCRLCVQRVPQQQCCQVSCSPGETAQVIYFQ